MGMTFEEASPLFLNSLEIVCRRWKANQAQDWGFWFQFDRYSIEKACRFSVDLMTGNSAFPKNPGPFKLTSAFVVSCWYFLDLEVIPVAEDKAEGPKDGCKYWKSRLIFLAIQFFLAQLKIGEDDSRLLQKVWHVPTPHYRLDFLNFLRLCDFPSEGPVDPTSKDRPTVNTPRVSRLIMAISLIIESCYYSSENDLRCDVKDSIKLSQESLTDEELYDLMFNYEAPPKC